MFSKIGHQIIVVESCLSTNTQLLNLIESDDVNDGAILMTHSQTNGRGQAGKWETNDGENLTFSFVLYPRFLKIADQFKLTQFVSLGIRNFLSAFLPKKSVKVKWPNDILVGDRKICGVLIENQVQGSGLNQSVIGIGLNVNQDSFNLFDRPATSMKMETGKTFELLDVLDELCKYLNQQYAILEQGRGDNLNQNYLNHLYQIDELKPYQVNGQLTRGKIKGVNEIGQLQFEEDSGQEWSLNLKEITFLSSDS